jgi:YHS domain-containing protein
MKTAAWMTIGLTLAAAAILAAGCRQDSTPASTAAGGRPGETPEAPQPVIAQKLCPVTDDPIDPKIYIDYKGRRIYFCCEMCPPMFKKDPEKYLKKIDEQIRGGAAPKTGPVTATPDQKVLYWTCRMHPDVKADQPGKCPKCGMTLVPVTEPPEAPATK